MLGAITRGAAQRFGDRVVVAEANDELTYGDLDRSADELAAGIAARGIGSGDVVALVLAPGCDWLVAAVAVSRTGAAFAGVSIALSAPERAALVELVAPRLALAHSDLLDGLPLRTQTVAVERGRRGRELAIHDTEPPDEPDDDQRPVAICFTSGTTGRPKAALFRQRQLRAVQRIDLGEDAESRWGGGAPMLASTQFAHVGMTAKLPWYLRLGATLHVMDRWRADDALRLVAQHRMPTIGVVAPQLALMLRSPLLDELDLSSVQSIIAGGAASPPSLVDAARRRFGAKYSIRYSSTESGGVGLGTAFDAPDHEALHTIGRPRPGVEVRIVDDDGLTVSAGTIGELHLRSDAVMDGYWNDPEATATALTPDRWLRTGDLASMDTTGCVTLSGRRTEMYLRGGYNVFPTEVESVLVEHPSVRDVVVVPVPDEVMGELGVALIVPADPTAPPSLEELRHFAEDRLARYKLPERRRIIERVPLTSAQKVDRIAASALLQQAPTGGDVQDRSVRADGSG